MQTARKIRYLFIIMALFVWISPCSAQDRLSPSGVQIRKGESRTTANALEGAKNPSQIPDFIAVRMFLTVASAPSNASPEEKRRQEAFLRAAGLAEPEAKSAATTLAHFAQQLTALGRPGQTSGGSTDRIDNLVATTMEGLMAGLSAASKTKLTQFIQDQKRNITLSSPPLNP